jgi:hypothetical protein
MAKIILNTGVESHFTPQGSDVEQTVTLTKLKDVTVTSPQDGDILVYNSSTQEWENTNVIDGGTF